MEKITQVKAELRQLRKSVHLIDTLQEVEARHLKRLELLKMKDPCEEVIAEIDRIEKILETLDTRKKIEEASAIEMKYICAINLLDPVDKAIILDGYMNGRPYWKIGIDVGYSEEGIRKRVNKIIERIARIM